MDLGDERYAITPHAADVLAQQIVDLLNVEAFMHAADRGPIGRRRLTPLDATERRAMKLIVDGQQASRPLRMMLPRLVSEHGGVGDEERLDGHQVRLLCAAYTLIRSHPSHAPSRDRLRQVGA